MKTNLILFYQKEGTTMSLNSNQLIDLGETLLKDYKYSVILYKNSSTIIFSSNYKVKDSNIKNIFFKTVEEAFNSLDTLSRKILYLQFFKHKTSTFIASTLFIGRSTVYRLRDKALIKIATEYAKIFVH